VQLWGARRSHRKIIVPAHASENGLLPQFADGTTDPNAQVILVTGFDAVPDHPTVSTVAESLSLQGGTGGFKSSH